jgi:hypothetical protein
VGTAFQAIAGSNRFVIAPRRFLGAGQVPGFAVGGPGLLMQPDGHAGLTR